MIVLTNKVYISGIGNITVNGRTDKVDFNDIADSLSHLNKEHLRNIDHISQLTIATATKALHDSGIVGRVDYENDFNLIVGTEYSALKSIHDFDMTAVSMGPLAVNPGLFPNTVLNSPICQVGIQLGFTGSMFTVCNGFVSSLDALGLSFQLIQSGKSDLIVSGGVDEFSELVAKINNSGSTCQESCVLFVLETENRINKTAKKYYAEIVGYDSCFFNQKSDDALSEQLNKLYNELLEKYNFTTDTIVGLYISTPFNKETENKLVKTFVQSINYACDYAILQNKYFGVTASVQLSNVCQTVNSKGVKVFLSIDTGKIAILIIKDNVENSSLYVDERA